MMIDISELLLDTSLDALDLSSRLYSYSQES